MRKTKPTNLVRFFHIRDYCEKIVHLIDGFDAEKFEQMTAHSSPLLDVSKSLVNLFLK